MIRVMVVDDHPVVRRGVSMILSGHPGIEVVTAVASADDAVAACTTHDLDVVLMDLSMPDRDGVSATLQITALNSGIAVVVLTSFSDEDRMAEALDAGAVGYVLKDIEPAELHAAVLAAARGESPLHPKAARVALRRRAAPRPELTLTERETEVLRLVVRGHTNAQIGSRLGISERTVKGHLTQVFTRIGVVAVALVTWMVFWMKRTARSLKRELEGKLAAALDMGRAALVGISFITVAREGIETSLFIWSTTQATSGTQPFVGAVLGLATAVLLGYLLYRSAVQINLATFFRWTGAGLVLVAAGVLAYGLHDLQEAGVLPGLANTAFDVSAQVPISSWYGALLKGTFNWNPTPTWIELSAWLAYLVIVMAAFLAPHRPAASPKAALQPAQSSHPV